MGRPRLNAEGNKELEKIENQINDQSNKIKSLDYDSRISANVKETEPQTKLSQSEIEKSKEIYLKPRRCIFSPPHPKTGEREKFNEKFREDYNYKKQYIEFIAENNEVVGESITLWTKFFPGTPAEEWVVPVNIPVKGPIYLRDQLESCGYTVFKSSQSNKSEEGINYTGYLEVQERKNRLNARDVPKKKNIYMGNRLVA